VSESRVSDPGRTLFTRILQIAALNAFAVAQPVFDRLGSNPEYLRLEDFSGIAIGTSLLLFLLAIPVATLIVMAILKSVKCPKSADLVFATVGMILVAVSLNIVFRWLQWRFEWRRVGIPDIALFFAGFSLALGCGWMYRRWQWPGQILNVAAIGIILFPLSLLSLSAMQAEILGITPKSSSTTHAKNPVPVVIVAFDGLCGMSLLNERHEIDAVRYPSFARLAGKSTFYRNATTVHSRTTQAMPAILTGQLPDLSKLSPVESNHPNNLFRLIYDTNQYDMTVFEPVTRLSPKELRQLDQTLSFTQQVWQLSGTLTRVYLNTSMPTEFECLQPKIPNSWFGIVEEGALHELSSRGLVTYSWDAEHGLQVAHFVRCLQKTEKPGFHFLHIVIPHDPWSHLPSGKDYSVNSRISEQTVGTTGEIGEYWAADELFVKQGWQRYLLQLQYADRCLGQIIDQLESIDEFERSLMIVVADHGMAFIPSQERRKPVSENLPDLMSVPLFIKLPGQAAGEITDRNVETIDVLPTIADVLQMQLPSIVDGASLVDQNTKERPRKSMYCDGSEVMVINPDFPQRFSYVDRMLATFGSGSQDDRLWSLDTIPELVGRQLTEFKSGDPSPWKCNLEHGGGDLTPRWPNFVPSYFTGHLTGPKISQPVQIAIAVNGRIGGTTRTGTNSDMSGSMGALLREEVFAERPNVVQLFEVERSGDTFVLHKMSFTSLDFTVRSDSSSASGDP